MDNLIHTTFGRLGQLFDGPHATPKRLDTGPYFLNISSLKSGRLDLTDSDHLSESDFTHWTRRVTPEPGDLLFSYETRLGEAALMPEGIRACLGRRMALLRPDRELVDPRFLLYFYLSPQFQRRIAQNTIHGATVQRIGLATMPSWPVAIPALATQRAIAEVLGALDDKIAANEHSITCGEKLAIAYASGATSSTEVGRIATHSTRPTSPDKFQETVAHYSLPAFDGAAQPSIERAQSIKSNKFTLTNPSVLISKLNPRIPRVWNVVEIGHNQAVASTEFVVLEPIGYSTSVLWSLLCQPEVMTHIAGRVAGTSGSHQRVKPAEILAAHVGDPDSLNAEVRDLIDCLGKRVDSARKDSQVLARTRDELLPLLMSGKLRVKDTEKKVEAIA
ncbi:restriction endonuclease subunit S [Nocardia sp. NPDC023852]|uniref:restriction endonuclease subunit S n=1 Tax=Nocardia sp. NPDC023852 TaxID=3154697 RepID=UPI00340C4669